MLGKHGLFLPGVPLLGRVRGRPVSMPVAALQGLAAIAPRGDAARIDDLALDMKAADQKMVAGVLQVLKYRARVLAHQDGMRGIVVDAELIADAMPLADAMQGDPRTRR